VRFKVEVVVNFAALRLHILLETSRGGHERRLPSLLSLAVCFSEKLCAVPMSEV
jgi:hypothetical protein